MSDNREILARLSRIEEQLKPLTSSARAIAELRDEMAPRVNELVHALIVELADVERDFQVEDLLFLTKKAMRNVQNFNFALDQLKNIIDFATTAEPLMKSTVPELIFFLDELERQGVFRLLSAALEGLRGVAAQLSQEELDQISAGIARLAGILKKLTTTEALDLMERAADLPGRFDLDRVGPLGPRQMLAAVKDPELREGLGVALALTRALPALKG